jgi:tRNA pseudouridine38-40 synthase
VDLHQDTRAILYAASDRESDNVSRYRSHLPQRKMMGMLILVTRSRTPASLIPEAFGPSKIHVPKSPSLGLLLEKPIFETYNGRVEDANKQMDALAARKSKKSLPPSAATDGEDFVKKDKLDYGPEFEVQVDKFKQQFIYDKLYAEERDHCS